MQDLVERLKGFELFKLLAGDPQELERVARVLEMKSYSKGEEIIRKNDEGDCAFLLLSGEVEVFDYTMDQEPFTRAVLDESMHPVFGEVALVGGGKRIATVQAKSDCRCGVLHRRAFRDLGDSNPNIGWKLLWQVAKLLSRHLEKTNQDVLQLFAALVMEVEHKTLR